MKIFLFLSLLISLAFSSSIDYNKYDHLFQKYEEKYGVSYFLLKAVAVTENDQLDPYIIRRNTNNTKDLGLMQINTLWIKEFPELGLSESNLLDPDKNIEVAAIILSGLIKQYGYSWETIGRYHSATPKFKRIWLSRIKKNIVMLAKLDQGVRIASR